MSSSYVLSIFYSCSLFFYALPFMYSSSYFITIILPFYITIHIICLSVTIISISILHLICCDYLNSYILKHYILLELYICITSAILFIIHFYIHTFIFHYIYRFLLSFLFSVYSINSSFSPISYFHHILPLSKYLHYFTISYFLYYFASFYCLYICILFYYLSLYYNVSITLRISTISLSITFYNYKVIYYFVAITFIPHVYSHSLISIILLIICSIIIKYNSFISFHTNYLFYLHRIYIIHIYIINYYC